MDIEKLPQLEEMVNQNIQDDNIVPVYDAKTQKGNEDRFSTGFERLDEVMNGGFKEGDLVVLSGVSGEGKTTMGQTFTYHLCKKAVPTLWFSYEVSPEFLDKQFTEMGLNSFYLAYTPKKNTTGKLKWIKDKIKEGWTKYATKVVFIDHLDFVLGTDVKDSDTQAIAFKKIATELKALAVELNVVIVSIAHLRKVPPGKEPDMQDIGYSAGIFQLADYVFIVQREKEKQSGMGKEEGTLYTNNSFIKIVKNRETGQLIYIKCQHQNGKFTQLTNRDDGGDPTNF